MKTLEGWIFAGALLLIILVGIAVAVGSGWLMFAALALSILGGGHLVRRL